MNKETIFKVDKDFFIKVDHSNWTVFWRKRYEHKGVWKERWVDIGYCHDLPASLKCIMRKKSDMIHQTISIETYLSWYEGHIHSMLDRVLRAKKEILEANEINGVIAANN